MRSINKKQKKRIQFLLIGVLLLFLVLIFIFANRKGNYLKIERIFHDIGATIEGFLIPRISNYDKEILFGINRELEEENKELAEMLEINSSEYHFIYATVIKRDIDWYLELTIDKGEKDGVLLDMAVISNYGLIGKIVKTTDHSSIVKLLSSNTSDMKVAVDIKNEEETFHGIIDGYLEGESLIQVNNIPKNSNIKVGDFVYTNGLGGIYPSGIYIGKVEEITYDSLGLSKIAKVKSNFSYDKLRYVTVVDRGN